MIKTVSLAAAIVSFTGSATMAADLLMEPPPAPEEIMTSGWDGIYIGGTVGYYVSEYVNLDAVIGGNFTVAESFLLGFEVGGGPYFDVGGGGGNGFEGYVAGRAGVIAGDSALLYGVLGYEVYTWGGTGFFGGAGAEFMVADQTSLRVQGVMYQGGDINVSTGVFLHF